MSEAAGLMDAMYRHQRHIGCGTGRNLIAIARTYPGRSCHGLDVSEEMLATARQSVERAGLSDVIALRQADATGFDPLILFGRSGFDRIVISYALSMIPPWQAVIEEAARRLVPGGELHIVDFGDQTGLPAPFRAVLRRWLALFQVTPRGELGAVLGEAARVLDATVQADALYRGYATLARLRRAA